jgi:hypothetical protein
MSLVTKLKKLLEKVTPNGLDIEGEFMSLPLRHFEYELRRTTPFTWYLKGYAHGNNDSIWVGIRVDKRAFGKDADIEKEVLDTLKTNIEYKKFVDSLLTLQPKNELIKNLYNLSKFEKGETSNILTYSYRVFLNIGSEFYNHQSKRGDAYRKNGEADRD